MKKISRMRNTGAKRNSGIKVTKQAAKDRNRTEVRRSGCPISFALDRIGDRWSLLLIRDLALKGRCSFSELLQADEGMATNVLSDRLRQLEEDGLILKRQDLNDRRRYVYRLTDAGKDLLPVLVELLLWGFKQDRHAVVPGKLVDQIRRDRRGFIRRIREKLDKISE